MDIVEAKKQIIATYGEGSVMTMQDGKVRGVRPICSTGSMGIDNAIGIGGYPVERIIEIYGPESSAKTTLALHAIAEVQKLGGVGAFIDIEHALDVKYAENLGVSINDLLISQPDYGEQAMDISVDLLRIQKKNPTKPLLIVVDSVDALVPKREIDGDFDTETKKKAVAAAKKEAKKQGIEAVVEEVSKGAGMGMRARLMSEFCRRITGNILNSNATFIFVNQIRMKIGVMFGNPETTSGGNALKFYASCRLDIRNLGLEKRANDLVVGNKYRVKIRKNKVAAPFQEHEGVILHGKGIDMDNELWSAMKDGSHVEKAGSWYTIPAFDKCKFQGYNGFLELINDAENRKQIVDLLTGAVEVDTK